MCDNFGKRLGSATCGPPKKRLRKFNISTATDVNCSSDQVFLEGNERNQPVADLKVCSKMQNLLP